MPLVPQDILPLLVSPTVTSKHYAQAALMSINASMMDLTPQEQMRVLLYAARWEAGIAMRELLSDEVEGERWLVWAACNVCINILAFYDWNLTMRDLIKVEEAPAALLLAQAALLSTKKHTWRKAALWYFIAANRLEKCGIVGSVHRCQSSFDMNSFFRIETVDDVLLG